MLTFFKPWRVGLDLKKKDETWDEAFNSHEFIQIEKQIMKNFNIKYECLDARDDFCAQMKAGTIPNDDWPINCMDNNNDHGDDASTETDPYVNLCTGELPEDPITQKISTSELR